jgi:hypothetical protein
MFVSSHTQTASKRSDESSNVKASSQPQKQVLLKQPGQQADNTKGSSGSKGSSDPHTAVKSISNVKSGESGISSGKKSKGESTAGPSAASPSPNVILLVKSGNTGNKGADQPDSASAASGRSSKKQDRPESSRMKAAQNKKDEVASVPSDSQNFAAAPKNNGIGGPTHHVPDRGSKEPQCKSGSSQQRVSVAVASPSAAAAAVAATAAASASAASTVRQILAQNAAMGTSEDSGAGRKVRTGFQAYIPRSARQENREDGEQG